MLNLFKKKAVLYQEIDAQQFAELLMEEDHVVLDVRSRAELSEGQIPGHQMIDFFDRDFKYKIAALDASKTYLVYCKSGMRSRKACAIMGKMGFEKLYHLKGGIKAWNSL